MVPLIPSIANEALKANAPVEPVKQKSNAQKRCEGKGGTWNEATKTCSLDKTQLSKTPEPEPLVADTRKGEVLITGRDGVQRIQTREDRKELEFRGGLPESETAAARIATAEKAAADAQIIEDERQRLIDEETPQRRELDPATSALERVPVLGGTFGAIKDVLQNVVLKTVPEGAFKKAFKENLGVAQPDELRTLALTEIERQEIEKGLTASEQFGALIEGIPVVGSLASKYAGGLIETPSDNAKQVKANILKERRRIANIETNVKLGYLPVSVAQEQIKDIEDNVQRLESRLKLLVNNSPELKFNSDLINTYETEILATREKALQAKQNILTGASQDPSEIAILQQLLLTQAVEE